MDAEDFSRLYSRWLALHLRELFGRKARMRSDRMVSDAAADEKRLARESDPCVVLPILGELASVDPALAARIQREFFAWLQERKVLKPIDPTSRRRRGRPRSVKRSAERKPPGAPIKWPPHAMRELESLVREVKGVEKIHVDGKGMEVVRTDAQAIEWLWRDRLKRRGEKKNPLAIRRIVKTWSNRLSKFRQANRRNPKN